MTYKKDLILKKVIRYLGWNTDKDDCMFPIEDINDNTLLYKKVIINHKLETQKITVREFRDIVSETGRVLSQVAKNWECE